MCSFFFQSRTNRNILLVSNARALELYITVVCNIPQLNKDIIFIMPYMFSVFFSPVCIQYMYIKDKETSVVVLTSSQ